MTEEQKQARYACVKRFMPFADDAAINKEVARREKQRIESEKLTNLRKQPREPPSIVSPSPIGAFAAACAAFKRTHKIVQAPPPKLDREGKRLVAQGFLAPPPATLPTWVPLASLSKFQALMNDLKALREAEPGFRAIVFTRHPERAGAPREAAQRSAGQGWCTAPRVGSAEDLRVHAEDGTAEAPCTDQGVPE